MWPVVWKQRLLEMTDEAINDVAEEVGSRLLAWAAYGEEVEPPMFRRSHLVSA